MPIRRRLILAAVRFLRLPLLAGYIVAAVTLRAATPSDALPASGWPEITRENKPWTRWWWPGSAVDQASLTQQLEKIAAAGIGGVEITPIYGATGYENRYLDFLSPQWMAMLEHVGREGRRLGLGIDMATGTGWPFGGPWIDGDAMLQKVVLKDGRLAGEPTKMLVKRAAPGDAGFVVDPFSTDSLQRYLAPFSKAFASFPRGLVRSQFHDSFEYYDASWTPEFARVFRQMHGYDVQRYAAELLAGPAEVKTIDADTLGRIKSDYRETLAKLHLDYLRTWVDWSHEHGFLVRNQSHGAPGNLLDLYANADIPETEIFGSTPFPIPGLRRFADEVRHDQDLPESLVIRMASSAAHVAGHKLASSESLTWLREHFKESPSYMKPELDRILCDGINHIFYHGMVFSPSDAPWPGWLFYASTQFNPNNPLWDDLGALNHYIARVQSVLQRGEPDNDVLLYWPFADVLDPTSGLMRQFTVHDVKWLTEQPVGRIARLFMDRGIAFDYISDAQLQQAENDTKALITNGGGLLTPSYSGALRTSGHRYETWTPIVVPLTRRMPVETLQKLLALAAGHSPSIGLIFVDGLPEDVPGYGNLDERRTKLRAELARLSFGPPDSAGIRRAKLGNGEVALCPFENLGSAALADFPEPFVRSGLSFVRRKFSTGPAYFIANLTAQPFNGWAALRSSGFNATFRRAELLDPLSGRTGFAAYRTTKPDGNSTSEVYLQLQPGESILIRLLAGTGSNGPPWPYREPAGAPLPVSGTWSVAFTKGGPELPASFQASSLKSWTELGGDAGQRFAGTAHYRLDFTAPAAKADDWLLDLGDVRETARVRLNGHEVGTLWSLPFQVRVGEFLQPGRNVLELDVTNLAANRIRDLDRRGVKWKIMREINFVNINYQPFDASGWELTPSGLLGPVTLLPLRALEPQ